MRETRGFEVLDELHGMGWESAHLVETGRDLETGELDYSAKVEVPEFTLAGRTFPAVDIYVSEGVSEDQLLIAAYLEYEIEAAGFRIVEGVIGDERDAWDAVGRALHLVLELARYGVSELER